MMEPDEPDKTSYHGSTDVLNESRSAVNSLILDYYKKFGRKRDLEQYFSLSTAQSEIRDPSSLFWRRLKMKDESSDSGEKPSESSAELCRISIKCTLPVDSSSQDEKTDSNVKNYSDSPPIITEEEKDVKDEEDIARHSDNESVKYYDIHSPKSADATLDTSMNKPVSPTSSVTSQRKLEWDSLADVGYANESERKASGSSLSTLERLALLQQYSNNDNKNNSELGPPTAHSTLIEPTNKSKTNRKGLIKRTREFHSKDEDVVEFNMPHSSNNPTQSISVNLTKHISFNVENDGAISVDNVAKDVKVTSPEKATDNANDVAVAKPQLKFDKEIQTSLRKSNTSTESNKDKQRLRNSKHNYKNSIPVYIGLNTLKRRLRKRKPRSVRKRTQKNVNSRKDVPPTNEKSVEQVSEAESFEYMPGHIYNQNQMQDEHQKTRYSAGNKSSLESSGGITTGSTNTNASFTRELEKSVLLLDVILKKHHDNAKLKKSIVKEVVAKLLQKRYRDEESTTDILSGLSFSSKRLGLGSGDTKNYTTTSTSDANNSGDKMKRPRKSILRVDKFNPNVIASTSQSAPNIPAATSLELPILPQYVKSIGSSQTESDISSKAKDSSDTDMRPTKTSSEELYIKYREAVKREEAYKKHLRDKKIFMRQKLAGSESAAKPPVQPPVNNKLKELMKDLTRNNYDDGSGDASKLEGSYSSNRDIENYVDLHKPRSHSVFTLSSGNSDKKCSNENDKETRKINLRRRLQQEIEAGSSKPESSSTHECCCSHKRGLNICDSVQLKIHNILSDKIKSKTNKTNKSEQVDPTVIVSDDVTGDIKYVYCVCPRKNSENDVNEKVAIYKCSRLIDKSVQLESNFPMNEGLVQSISPAQTHTSYKVKPHSNAQDGDMCKTGILKTKDVSTVRDTSNNITCGSDSKDAQISSPHKDVKDKTKFLLEITRCIQTEISIDPKIPDPTLSDINIVNNCDCVMVVSENLREIPSNSKNEGAEISNRKHSNTQISPRSNVIFSEPYRKIQNQAISCQTEAHHDLCDSPTQCQMFGQSASCYAMNANKNYAIPVFGTNMTLLVNFDGDNQQNDGVTCRQVINQGISTDGIKITEKSTCLQEECTKGNQIVIGSSSKPELTLRPLSPRRNVKDDSKIDRNFVTNTCVGNVQFKFNTYPKTEKKHIFRSNTDTELIKEGKTKDIEFVEIYTSREKNKVKPIIPSYEEDPQCSRQILKNFTSKSSSENTKSSNQNSSLGKSDEFESTDDSGTLSKDPILVAIESITQRYAKQLKTKTKKKKCFSEIMQLLKFLLETEEVQTNIVNFPTSGDLLTRGNVKRDVCECVLSDQNDSESENIEIDRIKIRSGTTLREAEPNLVISLDGANPKSKEKLNWKSGKSKNMADFGSICQPLKIDMKCSTTSLKSGSDIKSNSTSPRGYSEDPHLCSSCGRNLHHKTSKQSTSIKVVDDRDKKIIESSTKERDPNNSREVSPSSTPRNKNKPCFTKDDLIKRDVDRKVPINCPLPNRGDDFKNKNCVRHERRTSPPTKNIDTSGTHKVDKKNLICKDNDTVKTQQLHSKNRDRKYSPSRSTDRGSTNPSPRNHTGDFARKPVSPRNTRHKQSKSHSPSSDRSSGSRAKTRELICSCGCGVKGCADKCNKGECVSSSSVDRSRAKKLSIDRSRAKKSPQECSCGCGTKGCEDKCNKLCDSKTIPEKRNVKTKTSETDYKLKQSGSPVKRDLEPSTVECSCGCGKKGCANKCNKSDCKKNISTSCSELEQKNTQKDSQFGTSDACNFERRTEKIDLTCSCGCGKKECADKCGKRDFGTETKTLKGNQYVSSSDTDYRCIQYDSSVGHNYEPDAKKTAGDCSCGCGKKGCADKCNKRDCGSETKAEKRYFKSTSSETDDKYTHKNTQSSSCERHLESRADKCTKTSSVNEWAQEEKNNKSDCTHSKICSTTDCSKCDKACQCGTSKLDSRKRRKEKAPSSTNLFVDKSIQMSANEAETKASCQTDSSLPRSSSNNESSDVATCAILNRIKRECDKYSKRCKSCHHKCGVYSSTSDNCDCKAHQSCHKKCRGMKSKSALEKVTKKCVAYNLILQTSESMVNDEPSPCSKGRQLKNIIVKVPPRCPSLYDNIPIKVTTNNFVPPNNFCPRPSRPAYKPQEAKIYRSSSVPNESEFSSTDDYKRYQALTCQEYLERNRPDFIERATDRQNCLKFINEARANERYVHRKLLLHELQGGAPLKSISATDIRHLAKRLGLHIRDKKFAPKFISEREMKKHSENIYKSLPEVVQKKEDLKKERLKKTNLLMANIFKKNLQRRTLRGSVNFSNYSTVIKI